MDSKIDELEGQQSSMFGSVDLTQLSKLGKQMKKIYRLKQSRRQEWQTGSSTFLRVEHTLCRFVWE